jgi:hypothetical protein
LPLFSKITGSPTRSIHSSADTGHLVRRLPRNADIPIGSSPHPTRQRVISNEAGRFFLPHLLLQMRRPAQREISLRSLYAPRPARPHHLMKKIITKKKKAKPEPQADLLREHHLPKRKGAVCGKYTVRYRAGIFSHPGNANLRLAFFEFCWKCISQTGTTVRALWRLLCGRLRGSEQDETGPRRFVGRVLPLFAR